MEKIIARLPELLPRALAGDPAAIGLLALLGISMAGKALKDKK